MKTVQINKKKKKRNQDQNGDKDKNLQGNVVQPGAESFAQQGKEIRCFCCGKEGELSTDCPLKSKITSKDRFNKPRIKHYKTKKSIPKCARRKMGEQPKSDLSVCRLRHLRGWNPRYYSIRVVP